MTHTRMHVRTHMVQIIISRRRARREITKYSKCNSFQVISDLLNTDSLNIAITQV